MENNNIDTKMLMQAIAALGKGSGLKDAVKNKDFGAILSSLPKNQADELQTLMNDKAARDKLLSSPQAQEILRKLGADGKQ